MQAISGNPQCQVEHCLQPRYGGLLFAFFFSFKRLVTHSHFRDHCTLFLYFCLSTRLGVYLRCNSDGKEDGRPSKPAEDTVYYTTRDGYWTDQGRKLYVIWAKGQQEQAASRRRLLLNKETSTRSVLALNKHDSKRKGGSETKTH